MRDRSLLLELFLEIEEAIRRIERRFTGIRSPDDFTCDNNGLDRLDASGHWRKSTADRSPLSWVNIAS